MKKFLLSALLVAGLIAFASPAQAGIPIFYNSGPQFAKLQNLPDSVTIENRHVNFGVGFEEFGIMWIPMWTWGEPEYVAITDNGKEAWSLDEEDLAYLSAEYGLDVSKGPKIPFWHKIGGKLIWAALLVAILWGYLGKDKKDEEQDAPTGQQAAE